MQYTIRRIKELRNYLIPVARVYALKNKSRPDYEVFRLRLSELELELNERQKKLFNQHANI